MNKADVTKFFKDIRTSAIKHSPEILTGVGIAGMVTTTILAVRATPKALQKIEEKKDEICENELTYIEAVQATWKCYIPAAVTGTFSIACLIGASSVNARRNAALATMYKISETAYTEYRDKVAETIGEKKEKTIREKVSADHIRKHEFKNDEIIDTGKGKALFLEPLSGRVFLSDWQAIKDAEIEINRQMQQGMGGYASVNDFFDELGLDHVDLGANVGWNAYNLVKLDKHPAETANGVACHELIYDNAPRYEYYRF